MRDAGDAEAALPEAPGDFMRLPPATRFAYRATMALARATGVWAYPMRAETDLERMRFIDKAYWLYKNRHPIHRPRRGSGLERYFAAQRPGAQPIPRGFEATCEATIAAAGDLGPHAYLARSQGSLFAEIHPVLFGADVSMANLEAVVRDGTGPAFRFDDRSAPPLTFGPEDLDAGTTHAGSVLSFLSAASNHSLDLGAEGVDRTLAALRARGIAFHGANERDEDAKRPTVLERRGVRIGVVSYTFGFNAHRPPPDRPGIVNRMRLDGRVEDVDFTLLDAQVQEAASLGVDFLIAQLHWGMEYETYPTPEQVDLAHEIVERGVDAIVGHHPHVVQPLELYRPRRDPLRVAPIAYSLGNLTNPFSLPLVCRGGILHLTLSKGRDADGSVRTHVADAKLHMVEQVVDRKVRRLQLLPMRPGNAWMEQCTT